jgi:hypothetical protein
MARVRSCLPRQNFRQRIRAGHLGASRIIKYNMGREPSSVEGRRKRDFL